MSIVPTNKFESITDFILRGDVSSEFEGFTNTKMYHLTLSTHIDKNCILKLYEEKIRSIVRKNKNYIEYFSVCHENGNTGDYPHTHVLLKYKYGLTGKPFKMDFFDYTGDIIIHAHIRVIKNHWHYNSVGVYHWKEDKDVYSNFKPNFNVKQKFTFEDGLKSYREGGRSELCSNTCRVDPEKVSKNHNVSDGYKMYSLDKLDSKKRESNYSQTNIPGWLYYLIKTDLTDNRDNVITVAIDAPNVEDMDEAAYFLQVEYNALFFDMTSGYQKTMNVITEKLTDLYSRDISIGTVILRIRNKIPHTNFYSDVERLRKGYFHLKIKNSYNKVDTGKYIKILILSNFRFEISQEKCSPDLWKMTTVDFGKIVNVFSNDLEREKDQITLSSLNLDEELIPLKIWPIETYFSGRVYLDLVNEMITNFYEPEITIKYRMLTRGEIDDMVVVMKNPIELRNKIFYSESSHVTIYTQPIFRKLTNKELRSEHIWEVTNISGKRLTDEQIIRAKNLRKKCLKPKDDIFQDELNRHKELIKNKYGKVSESKDIENIFPCKPLVIPDMIVPKIGIKTK